MYFKKAKFTKGFKIKETPWRKESGIKKVEEISKTRTAAIFGSPNDPYVS